MTTCKERPTVLYDEDGHPTYVSVEAAATPRQAARIALSLMHDGALGEYVGMTVIDEENGVARPILSEYRELVDSICRWWMYPTPGTGENEGIEVWFRCNGPSPSLAAEFWQLLP